MGKRTYSDEEKATAIELYLEFSTAEAARLTEIPQRTIRQWVGDAGLAAAKREQTQNASEALAADIEDRRASLRDLLLRAAEAHISRSMDVKPREAQALATAGAILIDKLRLELGEATSRVESRDLDAAAKARSKVDDLAERRSKKTA